MSATPAGAVLIYVRPGTRSFTRSVHGARRALRRLYRRYRHARHQPSPLPINGHAYRRRTRSRRTKR
jgi:hypothetical protein